MIIVCAVDILILHPVWMVSEVEEGDVIWESSFHVCYVTNARVLVDILSCFTKGGGKVFMLVSTVLELLVEERGVFLVVLNFCILLPVSFELADYQTSKHSGWMCG